MSEAAQGKAPDMSVESIRQSIDFMRSRYEQGQGGLANAMCRLSLPMAERLLAELTELRLEIAAWQGRPEGGLEGWEYRSGSFRGDSEWRRQCNEHVLSVDPLTCGWDIVENGLTAGSGWCPTPRQAMRAAEVAAGLRETQIAEA